MASPLLTTPPGELMYSATSRCGFSASRNNSCAHTSAATPSSIGPLMKMMRSRSSREKMSNERSPRGDCSITMGMRFIDCSSGGECQRAGPVCSGRHMNQLQMCAAAIGTAAQLEAHQRGGLIGGAPVISDVARRHAGCELQFDIGLGLIGLRQQ